MNNADLFYNKIVSLRVLVRLELSASVLQSGICCNPMLSKRQNRSVSLALRTCNLILDISIR
jgi:hypothetical protein